MCVSEENPNFWMFILDNIRVLDCCQVFACSPNSPVRLVRDDFFLIPLLR